MEHERSAWSEHVAAECQEAAGVRLGLFSLSFRFFSHILHIPYVAYFPNKLGQGVHFSHIQYKIA